VNSTSYEGDSGPRILGFDKQRLHLHRGLSKAESSILIQLRTGKVGLNRFLHLARVPGVGKECECQGDIESVRHFLLACPRFVRQHRSGSLSRLLSDKSLVKEVARWAICTGRFEQFSFVRGRLAL
jgi:hypothetical protein